MLSTRLTIIAFLAVAWCWTSHGLSDLACPGVNSELKCPEGQVIQVLSMGYGRESVADCRARDRSKEAPIFADDCVDIRLYPWVRTICDELNSCRLPKPNPDMFACKYSEDNYIQIKYACNDRVPDLRNTAVCEGGVAELKCASGAIKIVTANFGRLDEAFCIDPSAGARSPMTFCTSFTSENTVKEMCNLKTECKISVNSDTLGTPVFCDSHPKYLYVDYVCE